MAVYNSSILGTRYFQSINNRGNSYENFYGTENGIRKIDHYDYTYDSSPYMAEESQHSYDFDNIFPDFDQFMSSF